MTGHNGTDVLRVQALRNWVNDLEAQLENTRLQLRLTTEQRDRRQQTVDALRMALTDRMNK